MGDVYQIRERSCGCGNIVGTWKKLMMDVEQYAVASADFTKQAPGVLRKISIMLTPSLMCCTLHRVAHYFYCNKLGIVARMFATLNLVLHKASISPASCIGGGLYIPHLSGLIMYGHAGERLTLFASAKICSRPVGLTKDRQYAGCPTLGSDVTVGADTVIWGNISVGMGSSVGTTAVVDKSIPPGSVILWSTYKKQSYITSITSKSLKERNGK